MVDDQRMRNGADIAARCGYSDQAHLIRECKALTGQTPARLMTSERSLAGLMREAGAIHSA
jgi:AraC-like DNA-binding protein